MLDDLDLSLIKEIVYTNGLEVSQVDEIIFIGKLNGGPLSYLHKIFFPANDPHKDLQNILGFPAPASYSKFFSFSDGATLFDNTLFLYGINGAVTREISVNNVRPISLAEQVELQRRISPDQDWVEVGTLAAATQSYSIRIQPSGSAALCSPNGDSRIYSRFLGLLLILIQILQNNSGPDGLIDPSAETLQSEIDSFLRPSRQ